MSVTSLVAGLLLGLAGYLANMARLELFFNVDYLFGSIFVMLAIARYGMPAGIIAGVLAGSCTWVIWHHPWAAIILIMEAVIVGWLVRRRSFSLMSASALFWPFIGIPLVWLFYSLVMGLGTQTTVLIALKQVTNGITNAIVAQVIYYLFLVKRGKPDELPRLRDILFSVIVAIIQVSSLVWLTYDLRGLVNRETRMIVTETAHHARSAQLVLDRWFSRSMDSVQSLARIVGDPEQASSAFMQHHLEVFTSTSRELNRLGVLNERGILVAANPQRNAHGESVIGRDYSDRGYIADVQKDGRPLVADLVASKFDPRTQVVSIVAPIVENSRYRGLCLGIADLDDIKRSLLAVVDGQATVTLLDRTGRVVVTNRSDLAMAESYPKPEGKPFPMGEAVVHYVPDRVEGSSVMQRWRKSVLVADELVSPRVPWRVIVESSPASMLNDLSKDATQHFAFMLVMMGAFAVLTGTFSRVVIQPLELLQEVSETLPERVAARQQIPTWPTSQVKEVAALVANFQAMAGALAEKFTQQQETYRRLAAESAYRHELATFITTLRSRVEQEERSRISRDLHDGIGQALAALKLNMQIVRTTLAEGHQPEDALIQAVIDDLSRTTYDLRDIVNMLRPTFLDKMTLCDAITWLSDNSHARTGLPVSVTVQCDEEVTDPERKYALFRIFQEAFGNAIKHSQASELWVSVQSDEQKLRLEVSDNGIGGVAWPVPTDSHADGNGLSIMHERVEILGGSMKIESPVGEGTRISVEVPVHDSRSDS